MIAKPKPEPDDGPEPFRTTPKRLSRQIRDRAVECADLAIRIRELAAFLLPGPLDVAVQELVKLSAMLSEHSIRVLVGKAEIHPEFADGDHQPERPLLDAIEAAPLNRAADQVAPQIAARGDTDPLWPGAWKCRQCGCTDTDCRQCIERTGDPCTWVEPDLCSACADQPLKLPAEHPAAAPARAAARRRKGKPKASTNGGAS